ncbi:hypothetical protein B296_00027579, partial [Ensete ventricosum]
LASKPYEHQWYLWIFWPFTHALVQLAWHIGTTFTVERNKLEKLRMETWMMPRYSFQKINGLIEEAILEADKRGAKVLSLGLLNQGDELNGCGMLYVKRNPKLKNWLPRRVMSAWRVAGIVHALEQWNKNECGETVSNIETMWRAALRHGFLPYDGVL